MKNVAWLLPNLGFAFSKFCISDSKASSRPVICILNQNVSQGRIEITMPLGTGIRYGSNGRAEVVARLIASSAINDLDDLEAYYEVIPDESSTKISLYGGNITGLARSISMSLKKLNFTAEQIKLQILDSLDAYKSRIMNEKDKIVELQKAYMLGSVRDEQYGKALLNMLLMPGEDLRVEFFSLILCYRQVKGLYVDIYAKHLGIPLEELSTYFLYEPHLIKPNCPLSSEKDFVSHEGVSKA
ncbi:hypothetical protein DSO57_1035148 [Entomophthora muscae]|uniref:Uncharacterized protein n=1 Tax=Entomophthora muscae TaxID=34485 RepID=A0ACC2SCB4_9FUNG|nr:hypothetical protein DSO57_1035148 [Entomophthora muscae]